MEPKHSRLLAVGSIGLRAVSQFSSTLVCFCLPFLSAESHALQGFLVNGSIDGYYYYYLH